MTDSSDCECLRLYKDAVGCLAAAAKECTKTSNVDINVMLSNICRGAAILEEIKVDDQDAVRQEALEQVHGLLCYHQEALNAKIKQLDTGLGSKGNPPTDNKNIKQPESSNRKNPHQPEGDDEDADVTSQKRRRRNAIQDTILKKKDLKFNDVAGLTQAKQALKEAIVMPLQYPHLFTGGRVPWRRILLYGPPGTGKSRLAQSLASEIKSTFYWVSSSDLLSSWVGESEKLIKELFQHARREKGRSVIFIDEIDSMCRRRSSGEEDHTRRVKNELLCQMEGAITTDTSEQVFLLAATNCPWELDPGFLRRFQKRIYLPLPDREARKTLMKLHMKETTAAMTDREWDELTVLTEGYSGSDLATLVIGALFEPIRQLKQCTHWRHTADGKLQTCSPDDCGMFNADMASLPSHKITPREIQLEDFVVCLEQHRNTVTAKDLTKFEQFTKNFGQNG